MRSRAAARAVGPGRRAVWVGGFGWSGDEAGEPLGADVEVVVNDVRGVEI